MIENVSKIESPSIRNSKPLLLLLLSSPLAHRRIENVLGFRNLTDEGRREAKELAGNPSPPLPNVDDGEIEEVNCKTADQVLDDKFEKARKEGEVIEVA